MLKMATTLKASEFASSLAVLAGLAGLALTVIDLITVKFYLQAKQLKALTKNLS